MTETHIDRAIAAVAPPLAHVAPGSPWIPAHRVSQPFSRIRVIADKPLTLKELWHLSGCLAYALRETLSGPELMFPTVVYLEEGTVALTALEFAYDAAQSRRTRPNYRRAFERARAYIAQGTPIRKTNRAGAGTRGTRLVHGIGPVCNITITVR